MDINSMNTNSHNSLRQRLQKVMASRTRKEKLVFAISAIAFVMAIALITAKYFDPIMQRSILLNSVPIGTHAFEMFSETDANELPEKVRSDHVKILERYAKNLDRGVAADLAGFLYPKYDSKRVTEASLFQLRRTDRPASESVQAAGIKLAYYFDAVLRSPLDRSVLARKLGSRPRALAKQVEQSVAESRETVDSFIAEPNMESARDVCSTNRETILTLVDGWRYDGELPLVEFSGIVTRAKEKMDELAESGGKDIDRERLQIWSGSEQGRLALLDLLATSGDTLEDIQNVQEFVLKTINKKKPAGCDI